MSTDISSIVIGECKKKDRVKSKLQSGELGGMGLYMNKIVVD